MGARYKDLKTNKRKWALTFTGRIGCSALWPEHQQQHSWSWRHKRDALGFEWCVGFLKWTGNTHLISHTWAYVSFLDAGIQAACGNCDGLSKSSKVFGKNEAEMLHSRYWRSSENNRPVCVCFFYFFLLKTFVMNRRTATTLHGGCPASSSPLMSSLCRHLKLNIGLRRGQKTFYPHCAFVISHLSCWFWLKRSKRHAACLLLSLKLDCLNITTVLVSPLQHIYCENSALFGICRTKFELYSLHELSHCGF